MKGLRVKIQTFQFDKLRTFLILISLFITLVMTTKNAHAQSSDTSAFDKTLENAFSTTTLPGYSLALVKDGELVEVRAGGKISLAGDTPITPETPMQIGSVSKSFAALAIMQLVEAGKLELDTPIENYLPEFTDKAAGSITLRQAMSHTSGLSTLQGNQTQTDLSMDSEALARRVTDLSNVTPELQPGQAFMYSNANYQIVGRIIELVSGTSYADYVQSKILMPLTMTDSYVIGGNEKNGSALGHLPWFGSQDPIESLLMGAGSSPQGGVVTTATDLSKYAIVMMNQKDDIISAQNKRLMMSPVSEAVSHYGLGWSIYPPLGLVWHNGSNPGFQAQLSMNPETQDAFVFIANGGNSYGFNEISAVGFNLTLEAMQLEGPKGGGGILSKAVFVAATLLPFLLIFIAFRNWQKREKMAQHSSLRRWFVTLTYTLIAALSCWALFVSIPLMFGIPLDALQLFVPDWSLILHAIVFTSIVLAMVRIGLMIGVKRT
ncbi:beta-lactamase family protein [Aliiglaciecola sp. M165]|nr:beta-lactamase family protein [Aliiglaciecola sp. M165]